MSKSTTKLVRAGLIAGLYVVLSLLTFPIASGAIQFRLSEALTLLPLFFVEAIPALFVGCLLSNLLTGCVLIDVILGSVITLVAAFFTYFTGKVFNKLYLKIIIGGLFPVILNAVFLPIIWLIAYKVSEHVYILQVAFLIISQTISVYVCGVSLSVVTKRYLLKE